MTTLTRHFIRKRFELLRASLEPKAGLSGDRPKPIEQTRPVVEEKSNPLPDCSVLMKREGEYEGGVK